jgi:hypothetical protein
MLFGRDSRAPRFTLQLSQCLDRIQPNRTPRQPRTRHQNRHWIGWGICSFGMAVASGSAYGKAVRKTLNTGIC